MKIHESLTTALANWSHAKRAMEEQADIFRILLEQYRPDRDLSEALGIEVTIRAAEHLIRSGEIGRFGAIKAEVDALRGLFGSLASIRMVALPSRPGDEHRVQIQVSYVHSAMEEAAIDAVRAMDQLIPIEVNP